MIANLRDNSLTTWRRHPRLVALCGAVILSGFLITFVDKPLALYVAHEAPSEVRVFFRFITDWAKGDLWFVICFAWLGIAAMGMVGATQVKDVTTWRHQARCAWFFLSSLIASGIVLLLAKFIIGRYRPRYLLRDETYGFLPFNFDFAALSYPSGHTQVIFCVATVVSTLWPRMVIPAFSLAAVLGFSRVMVNAHYLADVVMGAYVGIVITLIVRDRLALQNAPLVWWYTKPVYKTDATTI